DAPFGKNDFWWHVVGPYAVLTNIIYPLVPSEIETIFFNTFIDCSIGKLVTLQTILFGESTDIQVFFIYAGDALFMADPHKTIIILRNACYGSFRPKIAEQRRSEEHTSELQ